MKTLKFQLFVLVAILSMCACQKDNSSINCVFAEHNSSISNLRSYEEALEIANNSIELFNNIQTKSVISRKILSGEVYTTPSVKSINENGDTLFYVFNFTDNAGFTIVAADKAITPLVAVTESGHYTPGVETGVRPFDDYMAALVSELLTSEPIDTTEHIDDYPDDYYYVNYYEDDGVPALISTQWGQQTVYGAFCPNGISGCVATAIAQVMAFHEHPDTLHLSANMSDSFMSGDAVSFNWQQIKQHTLFHSEPQECDSIHGQISALMREIGIRGVFLYENQGSAPLRSPTRILTDLHYNNRGSYISPSYYSIVSSINAGQPILISGDTVSHEGHCWIIDGYLNRHYYRDKYIRDSYLSDYYFHHTEDLGESHYVHMNWGWDGDCNGYFMYGEYDTTHAMSYDSYQEASYSFYNNLEMLLEIAPAD